MKVVDAEYLELTLTAAQKNAVIAIFYAHAAFGAKLMAISTVAPSDDGLWKLQVLGLTPPLSLKLHRVLGAEDRQKALLNRIEREAPAIAARLDKGEFKSLRQAAVAAKIIKTRSNLDSLRAAWKRCNPEEQDIFMSEISIAVGGTTR